MPDSDDTATPGSASASARADDLTAASTRSARSIDPDSMTDEEWDALPAEVVPARFVAEEMCRGLPQGVRRALGRHKIRHAPAYVSVEDLVTLGVRNAGAYRPTIDEVDRWCHRLDPPGQLDIYADAVSLDELRALITGSDPNRKLALATIARVADETGAEWARLAVKRLRDLNTVARFTGQRRAAELTLPTSMLLSLGATATDLAELPAADPASRAASGKIVEAWTEQDRAEARAPRQPAASIALTRASDVERQHIDWLWTTADRDPLSCDVAGALIPLHGLSLIAGREGAAKSTFLWWLAAQITRGTLPGHYLGKPRDVVVMATEETETAIRLRLEVAGADLDRVYFPSKVAKDDGTPLTISIGDDIGLLSEMLSSIEPGAVFLDPLKDFLGGVNTDREDEVRPALVPLLELTAEHDCAVIGLIHLNKMTRGDFLTRLAGSGAFKHVPRVVFGLAHDDLTDTRVLQQRKNNGAEMARGAFLARVESVEVTFDGRTERVGRWTMDGTSVHGVDAILAQQERGERPPSAAERAEAFLTEYLDDGAPHPFAEIAAAAARLNITEPTLKRARRAIGATSTRENVRGAGTFWQMPTSDADA